MNYTSVSYQTAEQYLSGNNWNVQNALKQVSS